jgi:hypothetical protein
MNEKIKNLNLEYDKLEKKYPNIIKINRKILEFHVNKINKSIQNCEKALEAIKKNDRDLTQEQIVTLYLTLQFITP